MKDIENIYTRKLYEAEMFLQKARQERLNSTVYNYYMDAAEKATGKAVSASRLIHMFNGRIAPISYN